MLYLEYLKRGPQHLMFVQGFQKIKWRILGAHRFREGSVWLPRVSWDSQRFLEILGNSWGLHGILEGSAVVRLWELWVFTGFCGILQEFLVNPQTPWKTAQGEVLTHSWPNYSRPWSFQSQMSSEYEYCEFFRDSKIFETSLQKEEFCPR